MGWVDGLVIFVDFFFLSFSLTFGRWMDGFGGQEDLEGRKEGRKEGKIRQSQDGWMGEG